MEKNIEKTLYNLSKSKFRSSFKLKEKDIEYINKIGFEKLEEHIYDFINKRLKPKDILNDGKQTPMRGHPVFIAQHATATCCRMCIFKWHHIKLGKELTEVEINFIKNLIIAWIKNEYNNFNIII